MKKLIIGIVVLAVVAVGAYLIFKPAPTPAPQTATTTTTTTAPATTAPATTAPAATAMTMPTPVAGSELHIYNWGDYTNPKLIEKFQKETGIKVTLDSYDSNETMLAKVRAGGTGYDIVVPSDYTVKIMVEQGMLAETHPNQMPNFKNVKPQFVNIYWDSGRNYSVPWQFGTTAFAVNTDKFKGDINTLAILFNPPAELKGRINVLDDEMSVIHAAERFLGVPRCNADKDVLKKVADVLTNAKPNWRTFSYDTITKMTSGDVDVTQTWNGAAHRMRLKMPAVKYAYTKEGMEGWMDNVTVLKDAPHMDNAKIFQNFIMDPENAALISEFAGYGNGIEGSDKFLPEEFANAPEIKAPADSPTPEFVPPCPPAVVEMYNAIWTNLRK
jgi:spermidine/putrescine transport system substrate-binding protein